MAAYRSRQKIILRNRTMSKSPLIAATTITIFSLVALAGCNDTVTDSTSVIVEIQSEFQAVAEIDQVKVSLSPSGKMLDYAVGPESDSSKKSFPIKFGLLPEKASNEDFSVEVEGLLSGVTIVKTGADAKFEKGATGHLVLVLHKNCAQMLACDGGTVCGMDGTCSVSRVRDRLPDYVDPKGEQKDGSVEEPTDGGCSPMSCAERGINCGTVKDCNSTLDCGNCAAENEQCGSGGTLNVCGCTKTTCAANGKDCGSISDGCGGTLNCGDCPSGQSCGGKGPNQCGTEPCKVKTCASLEKNCGSVSDGCSATLDCGTCTAPNVCGRGNLGPNVCGCTPKTCASVGADCGEVPDGCGSTLNCGQCTQPNSCAGGGKANVCGCAPKTCQGLGKNCGTVPNDCGGTLDCGNCVNGDICGGGGANVCGAKPCVNTTCQAEGANCGTISNGCGGTLNCGNTCPVNTLCAGGGTANICGCTPTTCQAQSKNCGDIPNNCGGTLNCGSNCPVNTMCGGSGVANVCGCTPVSCASQGKNCGGIPNGCGQTLDCGTCPSGQICGGAGTANVCGVQPCVPTTCAAQTKNCGSISDGCGVTLNCGACSGVNGCGNGGMPNVCGCTPTTCGAQGKNCGNISDGCGNTINCGSTACSGLNTCGGGGNANVCGCAAANAGAPCNGGCGTVQCNGSCSTNIANAGNACGCNNMGTFGCDGTTCSAPKCANGIVCQTGSDCASNACTTLYRDADGDTFGNPNVSAKYCGGIAAGYVSNATDCCDSDANAKPGQATYFSVARNGCGGFDYNCDQQISSQSQFLNGDRWSGGDPREVWPPCVDLFIEYEAQGVCTSNFYAVGEFIGNCHDPSRETYDCGTEFIAYDTYRATTTTCSVRYNEPHRFTGVYLRCR